MRAFLLLTLAVLGLSAPGAAAQVPLEVCNNFAGREVFAEVYGEIGGSFDIYRATDFGNPTDSGFVGAGSLTRRDGCDFIWEFNGNDDPGSPADVVCTRGQYPCNDARGVYLLFVTGDVYLYGPGLPSGQPPSFYSPYGGGAAVSPDVGFGIFGGAGQPTRVKAIQGLPSSLISDPEYYENVLPNGYVLPYDYQTAGQQGGNGGAPGFFLTKIATNCSMLQFAANACGVDPLAYRFAPEGDARLFGTGTFAWDLTGITLSFGPTSRLILDRPITVTGGTLTARDAAQGWGGVQFTAGFGSVGGMTATVVEFVKGEAQLGLGTTAAITVDGVSPTFNAVTVRFPVAGTLIGLSVTGAAAAPAATGLIMTDMTGRGVLVNGGARLDLFRGEISGSDGTALAVAGTGTRAYLRRALTGDQRGPQITLNEGGGVAALSNSAVYFGTDSPAGPGYGYTSVTGNGNAGAGGRGLLAGGGADIYAGTGKATSVSYQRNRVFDNFTASATGNAYAAGTGSAVFARCAWWNTTNPTAFRTGAASVAAGLMGNTSDRVDG